MFRAKSKFVCFASCETIATHWLRTVVMQPRLYFKMTSSKLGSGAPKVILRSSSDLDLVRGQRAAKSHGMSLPPSSSGYQRARRTSPASLMTWEKEEVWVDAEPAWQATQIRTSLINAFIPNVHESPPLSHKGSFTQLYEGYFPLHAGQKSTGLNTLEPNIKGDIFPP